MTTTATKDRPTWAEAIRHDGVRIRTEPMPPGLTFERDGRNWATVIEPLTTDAGPEASPYCCYINTVVFCARKADGSTDYARRIDQVDTTLSQGGWTERMLWWRGCWWEIGCGSVRWDSARGWTMRHRIHRNGRASEEWNGEGWLYSGRRYFKWWWWWPVRLTRPLRDLLRTLRIWPGRPPRGHEIAWKVVDR